jgi:GR25 family glycosyltransferase involved in LPS biosynthesis
MSAASSSLPKPRHASVRDVLDGARIFWINSDTAVGRRRTMRAQLGGLGATRVRALLPSILTNQTQSFNWKVELNLDMFGARWNSAARGERVFMYSKKELACTLSHLHAVQTALDSFTDVTSTTAHDQQQRSSLGGDVALILEDDVTFEFCRHWPLTVRQMIARAPAGWQIIQLQTYNLQYVHGLREMCGQNEAFLPWYYEDFGAVAYLISLDGVRRLLRRTGWPDVSKVLQFITYPGRLGISDQLLYDSLRPHAYTFTRPLWGSTLAPTTIQTTEHQAYIERPMLQFARGFYNGTIACEPLALAAAV